MKKLALALVCLVSVAFFASCTPEGQPTIQILTEEGYVQNNDVLDMYTDYLFGFDMASSTTTNKELTNLKVNVEAFDLEGTSTGVTEWANKDLTGLTSFHYVDTLFVELERYEILGSAVVTAVVTDAAGQTATASFTVSVGMENALEPVEFTWNRHGGAAATGLDEFGLEWNSNAKEIYAVITPKEGAILYRFDPEVWEATTTTTEKAALFGETAISVAQFKEVSCTAVDKDYDIVLGTSYNGEFHLIHVTHSHVFTFKGTDVTITGEAK